jgi:hypothetical protein
MKKRAAERTVNLFSGASKLPHFAIALKIKPCIYPHLNKPLADLLVAKRHLFQKTGVILESDP